MSIYVLSFLCLFSMGWCQNVHFDCPPLPPLTAPARTVYELRPQDIKVVMALGDSVTAGYGMMGSHGSDLIADLNEYRGKSWCIGMDENAQTLPNFLRTYTPNIVGGSLGHHVVELCYDIICPPDQHEPAKDVFNAAQSGAMITNLVSNEFNYLLKQLNEHKEVDMKNDWKLLTLFIGANDLCLGCSGKIPTLKLSDFDKHMREVLEEVRKNIPKVFVNLVLIGNISGIYELSLKSKHCATIHRFLPIECLCAFAPGELGKESRLKMDQMAMAMNRISRQIAQEYALKRYADFAVIIQPFVSNTQPDHFTVDFLSQLDCFHPSLLAHENMAKALWNNMITPAAEKMTSFNFKEKFKCPTNETLLYTY